MVLEGCLVISGKRIHVKNRIRVGKQGPVSTSCLIGSIFTASRFYFCFDKTKNRMNEVSKILGVQRQEGPFSV